MNPSLIRLLTFGKVGGRLLGRFSGLITILGTPTYYMGKAFHKYWLKDDNARKTIRNYTCNPYDQKK